MIRHADIVVDLQAGDTGKGKVSHWLAKNFKYDAVLRYNGGANAGHTIYHNGQKVVTHQVPVGVFYGIPSIIGVGCVVNLPKLRDEIEMLKNLGFQAPIMIDGRCHVTTEEHIREDSDDTKIGTTRQGIGPTYRDKYARTGTRIANFLKYNSWDLPYDMIDTYHYFHGDNREVNVLCEGAQGFQIDIDWGDYPYVTSSHCTSGAVALNGVPPRNWRSVYGIMKAYETYSGFKTHFTEESPIFEKIQEVGQEFGATTGRKRQVRWLHLDGVIQALYINDVTHLIINKVDVLEQVNGFGVVFRGTTHRFHTSYEFQKFVEDTIRWHYRSELHSITWSRTPEGV
jgi:adenylosuccinate synthase